MNRLHLISNATRFDLHTPQSAVWKRGIMPATRCYAAARGRKETVKG